MKKDATGNFPCFVVSRTSASHKICTKHTLRILVQPVRKWPLNWYMHTCLYV